VQLQLQYNLEILFRLFPVLLPIAVDLPECFPPFYFYANSKTNSVAFSPQANYTDWAAATSRVILVPNFVDGEGAVWSARRIPHAR
jgi:hypothetical protein